MKINSNSTGIDRIQLYQNQINKIENDKPKQKSADKLEISSQAKDLQLAAQLKSEREERIQQIQKQIEEGSYKVQPSLVAEKMLQYFSKN
ncbi:flagellar biosynthesis anti-sigma factor FlgM [Gottfriedia solisilvae]|uniref:Negative regulator of flagellin synthesis n=1 Tax=Gottfriedia solisilvae TaxID=1516104 RepID=A0A8J3F1F7_9BACI|nr:flagellar biosynthesis anti-sigma factor FlgM [Gottfriedia solisilvae]GGI16531.1 negative regulator of flagellin synthesis [Gottfriedia solisilvae]